MTETKLYQGWLSENGDDELLLYGEPLAGTISDDVSVSGKKVVVRYWICDNECSRQDAEDAVVKTAMGDLEAEFCRKYGTSWTGYYGTDESFVVGGHDMLEELRLAKDKYLILELEIEG